MYINCEDYSKNTTQGTVNFYKYHSGEQFKGLPEPFREKLVTLEGTWYTGISSNPVQSLEAHGVNLENITQFVVSVVPVKYAAGLKKKILALTEFVHVSEEISDYVAKEQTHTYLYSFKITPEMVLKIDTAGFSPLKYLPSKPLKIHVIDEMGVEQDFEIDCQKQDTYPLVAGNMVEALETLKQINVRHKWGHLLQVMVEEGCFVVLFDPRTSQSGYVQIFMSGESDEKVVFCGEKYKRKYLCEDKAMLNIILLAFFEKGEKPRKTKWESIQRSIEIYKR